MKMVSKQDIEQAYERLVSHMRPSPMVKSPYLSAQYGCEVWLKLENRQLTGSFKERGAFNKLQQLTKQQRMQGIIAASAGNHAQGVAYHATRLGIQAKIVMPIGAPLTKVVAVQSYGGEVILHGQSYDEAFEEAQRIAQAEQLTFIAAFDDPAIITGQGTIAMEIVQHEAGQNLDAILCPVGGGGLIAGLATYFKAVRPAVKMIGVEAAECASMAAALQQGQPVTLARGGTLADGIAVKRVGALPYQLATQHVDELLTVAEDEIAQAILQLLEREKIVVEGAGAVPLAALAKQSARFAGQKLLLIISGGNIDVNILNKIITRGLAASGRAVALNIRIPDQPGYLRTALAVVSQLRANVLEVSHHRHDVVAPFGYVDVSLTLETRGHEHIARLKTALAEQGYLLS